jgi:hypothetical protein
MIRLPEDFGGVGDAAVFDVAEFGVALESLEEESLEDEDESLLVHPDMVKMAMPMNAQHTPKKGGREDGGCCGRDRMRGRGKEYGNIGNVPAS